MKYASLLLFLCGVLQAQTYTETILYSFGQSANDGIYPNGIVIDSKGNLYGTTQNTIGCASASGRCGTAFRFDTTGKETILHRFTDGSDGAWPGAQPTLDSTSNLYGTTQIGGSGSGTVFKITSKGVYSILHKFGVASKDGNTPLGPMTLDSAGNIYGMTYGGGDVTDNAGGAGIIFKLNSKGTETILHEFTGGSDGGWPMGNLILDGLGNLYGATTAGGTGFTGYNGGTPDYQYGGILFKATSKGRVSALYNFCQLDNCSDGARPMYIARNASGYLFGNLEWVDADVDVGVNWAGGVFKMTAIGAESVPVAFDPYDNSTEDCNLAGCTPTGPVSFIGGVLYGSTTTGGAFNDGTLYSVTSSGQMTVLYSFGTTPADGAIPTGALVQDSRGKFYGVTEVGGTYGYGAIFKLTKN